jgi:ABC-2 type transport system permease protein
MRALALTFSQVRYVNKAFWRNPSRAFFTLVFPLMFLVIFTALLGNNTVHLGSVTIKSSTYYVAAMAAFAVITSCYMNIGMTMAFQRDAGILKRIDGSPLPRRSFLSSRILHSVLVAVLLVAITAAFGRLFYDAHIPSGLDLARFLVMLIVGAAAFCALGLAVTAVIPNADAAPAIVNASILPLLFLSGIFIPFGNSTPSWVQWVARIFPVRHFAQGMLAGFVGTPFRWSDVLFVAVWGLAGLLLSIRYFAWEPRTE